jgi:tripartite-type tricarboxylate transporter receptor subunit TctC
LLLAAGTGAALPVSVGQAQPTGGSGSIRLVVPFAPGGSVDVLARLIAPKMTQALRQDVIVENRTGAAGLIAAESVAQSPPNGLSLLVASGGQMTIAAALQPGLSFDPMRDLVPVTHLVNVPYVFAAGPSLPQGTLKEVVDFARANPGKVTYASPGTGSVTHLMMELLGQQTGTRFVHVPYRGTGQATTDLTAGRVDMTLSSIASVKPQLDRGDLRPIAVAGDTRLPQLPKVPTTAEQQIDGMDAPVWIGLVTRYGTPDGVIARIDAAAREALAVPELVEKLGPLGMTAVAQGPAAFAQTLAEDAVRWKEAVTRGNIRLD